MRIAGLSIFELPRVLIGSPGAGPAPAALRQWASSYPGGGLLLVLLCLGVYLPGLWSIPPVDRDESRFAQASRQMFESRDFIVPRIQDRPRLNKPPLIYWLQCASIAVFADRDSQYPNANIWVFRVPSVLCAIASVLLTWRLGLRMFDPRAALLAAALLAVSPMVIWDAHQARADQLLLATSTAAMFALWCVWSRASSDRRPAPLAPIAFWLALAVAILAKGPIAPMIAALTILALAITTRRWRWILALRPLLGLLIVVALVGPWVYAVAQRVGPSAYLAEIYDETIGRSKDAMEGHWGPPGYHLVLLVVLFWPGVLLTAVAVRRACARAFPLRGPVRAHTGLWARITTRWRSPSRGRRAELFLVCWITPAWLTFELLATKLPHYTLPMYPAIALLSARALLSAAAGTLDHLLLARPSPEPRSLAVSPFTLATKLGFYLWLIIAVAVFSLAAAAAVITIPGGLRPRPSTAVLLASALLFIAGIIVFLAMFRALQRRSYLRAVALAMLISVASSGWFLTTGATSTLPGAATVRIVDALRRNDPSGARPIASTYHEDSLIFWTRGRSQRINPDQLDHWFALNPRGLAVVAIDAGNNTLSDLQHRGYTAGPLFHLTRRTHAAIIYKEPTTP